MPDYIACSYSKSQIVDAGKFLAGTIIYDRSSLPDVIETFRIAHSWRAATLYPMRRVRDELGGKIRSSKVNALTAARLKRMTSIRKKLRSSPLSLYQMQDLGGCRAIIGDQSQLDRLVGTYEAGDSTHAIVRDNNHISAPRANTGYRSRHLTLKFRDPEGRQEFNRHFVEVQFRTRVQHFWATAVEAVGLVRDEDLKGGRGNADWLRLFQLMAGEMAEDEGTAPVPTVSIDKVERRKELVDLNRRIDALKTLRSYNTAIRNVESYAGSAPYYLIQYDTLRKEVRIRPFDAASVGSEQYRNAEYNLDFNAVLVEVDRVADLRSAYPNYFLDVEAFAERLERALTTPASKQTLPRGAGHLYQNWKQWRASRQTFETTSK